MPETTPAPVIPFGFCVGTTPQKWLRRWQQAQHPQQLAAAPISQEGMWITDAYKTAELAGLLADGGLALVRTVTGTHPQDFWSEPLNAVALYTESTALLAAKKTDISQLKTVTEIAELELTTLLTHPLHLPGWPQAMPWRDPQWEPKSSAALAELIATELGTALLPLPVARQVAVKGTHSVLPVTAALAQDTTVWAIWLRAKDSPALQNLIGVLRGRRSNSARNQSSEQSCKQQVTAKSGKQTTARQAKQATTRRAKQTQTAPTKRAGKKAPARKRPRAKGR